MLRVWESQLPRAKSQPRRGRQGVRGAVQAAAPCGGSLPPACLLRPEAAYVWASGGLGSCHASRGCAAAPPAPGPLRHASRGFHLPIKVTGPETPMGVVTNPKSQDESGFYVRRASCAGLSRGTPKDDDTQGRLGSRPHPLSSPPPSVRQGRRWLLTPPCSSSCWVTFRENRDLGIVRNNVGDGPRRRLGSNPESCARCVFRSLLQKPGLEPREVACRCSPFPDAPDSQGTPGPGPGSGFLLSSRATRRTGDRSGPHGGAPGSLVLWLPGVTHCRVLAFSHSFKGGRGGAESLILDHEN